MDTVTVAIPTIPPRIKILQHALSSVYAQTQPALISVAADTERRGAWHTRQRALNGVRTPWVAFLDDDDDFESHHLELLLKHAADESADYVFSWYHLGTNCGNIDRLGHFGREFDHENPHHTTMTVLVRTELAREVGFTPPEEGARVGGEDWRFTLGCVAAGAKIVHLPQRTWTYHCFPGGTHGMPVNW